MTRSPEKILNTLESCGLAERAPIAGFNAIGYSGAGSAMFELAVPFLDSCNERYRKYVLWDIAADRKYVLFMRAIADANFCGIAIAEGFPFAMSWIVACGRNSRMGAIHFAFANSAPLLARACGRAMLERAKAKYDSLICLAPAPLRNIAGFVSEMGFTRGAVLRDACWIEHKRLLCDGLLFYINL